MDTKMLLGLVARHLLGAAGAWLVGHGMLDQGAVDNFVGAGMLLAAIGWSAYQKYGVVIVDKVLARKVVASPAAAAAVAAKAASVLLLAILLLPTDVRAQAGLTRPKLVPLTGNVVNDLNASRAAGIASGNDVKLTGDPIADLHAAIQKQGAKLIMHLKQSYALAMAKAASGSVADNTSANCTKALVPIVSLVVNGPPAGTLDAADPMVLTADETRMAADTGEPEGPVVKIEKLRILRLALTSPALNDACGALVQDEVKNAQNLVGKITSLITGAGLAGIGL